MVQSSRNVSRGVTTKTVSMNFGAESKSIDFQVTYIERKQESFYKQLNATHFLKSTNITQDQVKNSTKFIN